MRTFFASLAIAVFVAFGTISPAQAAPQILAVMASNTAQPMTCENGVCSAELTTFCLQKSRGDPDAGTAYMPYAENDLNLVLRDANGDTSRISAAGLIEVRTFRGFTAVVAKIDEAALNKLGAVSAAIEIGPLAMLLPVPVAGDHEPITTAEAQYTRETLRPMADQWIAGTGEKAAAVRMVNTMINTTPLTGRLDEGGRSALWDQVASSADTRGDASGMDRARGMYDACAWRVEIGRYFNMRSCLEIKHDSALLDMNLTYWKATAAGS